MLDIGEKSISDTEESDIVQVGFFEVGDDLL